MNVINCEVVEVLQKPYQMPECSTFQFRNKWFVKIIYNAYGIYSEGLEMFDTKEEAENLKVGSIIQK